MAGSRVEEVFARQRAEARRGLIPFVTAGYPTLEVTATVLPGFEGVLGPAVLELGIPFSDPIADGPVIAASMHEALLAGVTPERVFETVSASRRDLGSALVAMVTVSIVERMGAAHFMDAAAAAGLDGLIVPDLDSAEGGRLADAAAAAGLTFTLLIAPTTPQGRIGDLARACSGFVYVLARTGITGERNELPDIRPRVEAVRAVCDLPVAVGFGISRPDQVAAAVEVADAAIVGTAIVRRMAEARDPAAAADAAVSCVKSLAGGIRDSDSFSPHRPSAGRATEKG